MKNIYLIHLILILLLMSICRFETKGSEIIIKQDDGSSTALKINDIEKFVFDKSEEPLVLEINFKQDPEKLNLDVLGIDSIYFNNTADSINIVYMNNSNVYSISGIDYLSFSNKYQNTLFKSNISNSSDFIFEIPNKLKVRIPKENIDVNDELTIDELNPTALQDVHFNIFNEYDIKLKSKNEFDEPIEIEIFIDNYVSTDTNINGISAAYYHDVQNKWINIATSDYNEDTKILKLRTKHLTRVSTFTRHRLYGYTDYYTTQHFRIYWSDKHILSDSDYNSSYSPQDPNYPHFINDLARYAEDVYESFKTMGLWVHSGKVDIYINDLGTGNGGLASFTGLNLGYLYINNGKTDKTLVQGNALQNSFAHEYLHYVQDYYYMALFSDYTTKWWLEATAANAERMVWGASKPNYDYQTCYNEWRTLNDENDVFTSSWDKCNKEPHWYKAGAFISWLMQNVKTKTNQSVGGKLLKDLLIAGGKFGLSSTKNILNNYLDTMLLGKDIYTSAIGFHYAQFLEEVHTQKSLNGFSPSPCWSYENPIWISTKSDAKGIIQMEFPPPPVLPKELPPGDYCKSELISIELKPLSGRIVQIYPGKSWSDEYDYFEINFLQGTGPTLDDELRTKNDMETLYKKLYTSVVEYLYIDDKKHYVKSQFETLDLLYIYNPFNTNPATHLELLFVNTDKDNDLSFEIIFSTYKKKK